MGAQAAAALEKEVRVTLERNRYHLAEAARAAFRNEDKAKVWLSSAHPELAGKRPAEARRTDTMLDKCLDLLPGRRHS